MASEDTGYLDGYLPATKDRLNKAKKELQKELKRVEEKSDKREERIWKKIKELWNDIIEAQSELQKLRDEMETRDGSIKYLVEANRRIKTLPSGPKEGKEEKTDAIVATSKQRLLLL